ncbi:MAG: error-prone DNA polymerase [Bdellovibrionales bacterium CG10_big_fil_rev_8_21_14_0_10_45_34]|nr:MAG: error-prone DNA polymerase [Bdellovibrionales bacterium CG10_big_fil_rev_8_21_14_0_10_45_34]
MGEFKFVELLAKTHYSFLEGASFPHEMVERALALNYLGLGIADRNGVYGAPKAWLAKKATSEFKLIIGSEVSICPHDLNLKVADENTLVKNFLKVHLIPLNKTSYGWMCRLLTAVHANKEKGMGHLSWQEWSDWLSDPRAKNVYFVPRVYDEGFEVTRLWTMKELEIFADTSLPTALALTYFFDGRDKKRFSSIQRIQSKYEFPLLASNQPLYHVESRIKLQNLLHATRENLSVEQMGVRLLSSTERYLKPLDTISRIYRDFPEAAHKSYQIFSEYNFDLSELRYQYPTEWIPKGHTAQSYLRVLITEGCQFRYRDGVPEKVEKQIAHELQLIEELNFADYFLTIWDIVKFARSRGILCQGRGSAANSIICYVLQITSVDPVLMDLLFERFLSAERGEPPDIDVDFEHERREEVIQYVYERYGRDRAAMVSAVITYRSKSALRDVAKGLGWSEGVWTRKESKQLSRELGREREEEKKNERKRENGDTEKESGKEDRKEKVQSLNLTEDQYESSQKLIAELKGFPRHLSIHSGGFCLSHEPIVEMVPVEPARMPGRTILQWDKYDLDALGLVKVDLLSLGMLTAIRKTMDLLGISEMADIPSEDPKTYEMIQKADTIGVFQIESRAQMGMLGRLQPKCFYDLVIQVAIVRPGPIVGKMVHPYLKRRRGLEPVKYYHPKLKKILGKTLGVPLFQEQVMKMAIELAGFSPGEADRLRKAIGAWRSSGTIEEMGQKLMKGLLAQGLPLEFVERIFSQIKGFAEYGFPESHAASFALIAYASCYLKCHHPEAFLCSLINSQPMGFYSVHSLVEDAKRKGIAVLAVDPNFSDWDCKLEVATDEVRIQVSSTANSASKFAIRLGFRILRNVSRSEIDNLLEERKKSGEFKSFSDFLKRCPIRPQALEVMCLSGVFETFHVSRREALWRNLEFQIFARGGLGAQTNLFFEASHLTLGSSSQLLKCKGRIFKPMTQAEEMQKDFHGMGLTLGEHPMAYLRRELRNIPRTRSTDLRLMSSGKRVKVAGLVIVRQRPHTARGTCFATLEDEVGLIDLILREEFYLKHRETFADHGFIEVAGRLQRDGYSLSVIVDRLSPLSVFENTHQETFQRFLHWSY